MMMILWCMSPSDLLPVYPITGYDCDEISLKIFMITLFLLKIISNVQDASYFSNTFWIRITYSTAKWKIIMID